MVGDKTFLQRVGSLFGGAKQQSPVSDASMEVVPLQVQAKAIGSYGTQSYSGYLSEEYLQALRGRLRADAFDKIRRSDPQIKMCLNAVKNPIKSAMWEVQPGDDSEEAKQDAELISHILFEAMEQSWVEWLGEALTMAEFGHSVFEVLHKVVADHPQFGTFNAIRRMAFRSQRTIERWNLDPATGNLLSISQYAYGDLARLVDIPAEYLVVLTLDQEGANYEGISLMRTCYGNWYRKQEYLKLNAIGIEKFAVPTPVVEFPPGQQNSDQHAKIKQVLENYTSHQSAYLLYPTGYKIDLKTSVYDPSKVEFSIDSEDKRMVMAFLANFLLLGTGSSGGGSYALSNDLSDFFLAGLEQIAAKIEGEINRRVIPALIQMNRGKRSVYPKLTHSDISDKAGRELAEIIKFLTESQAIVADDPLEEHLRKRYRLPKKSDQGQRKVQSPGMGGGFGGAPQAPQTLAERIHLAEAKRARILGE